MMYNNYVVPTIIQGVTRAMEDVVCAYLLYTCVHKHEMSFFFFRNHLGFFYLPATHLALGQCTFTRTLWPVVDKDSLVYVSLVAPVAGDWPCSTCVRIHTS